MFVRGPDGWITCKWKYLEKVPAPFGELAWDHVSGRLAEQGRDASELERAQAVDDLLRRAYHGPPGDAGPDAAAPASPPGRPGRKLTARERRVAARTRATTASRSAGPADLPAGDGAAAHAALPGAGGASAAPEQDDSEPVAKVIPLGIFNAHEEAKKRW